MPLSGNDSNFVTPPATALPLAPVPLGYFPKTSPERQWEPATKPEPAEMAETSCESHPLPEKSFVWGVPFDCVTMEQSIDQIGALIERGTPSYVITANLNYVMLHHQSPSMLPVTADAAMILADGQPIVWQSRRINQRRTPDAPSQKPLPERVAGSEMIFRLAQRGGDQGWGIYFLGGSPGVAAACANRLSSQYPGLRVAGVESPPFRKLTDQEQQEQDERITRSGADILLVAFGQPKGELWIHQNHRRLGVPVSIQLGASFDFIAGTATRAPRIWQRCGMEWAYRMLGDPKRLVPRYWSNAKFLFNAIRAEQSLPRHAAIELRTSASMRS
jgi:N-acetylglucosaminyldiphosphoundecaprenol N-acetyl-beta-D-mannosaminyltransferase